VAFERWRELAEATAPRLLYMTREALMRHAAAGVTEEQYPETMVMAGTPLPLAYRFAPGHPLDGLTLTVPLALLNQLDDATLSWLVPGMIRDKVTHYLKALPKAWRNRLIPLPETVSDFLDRAPRAGGSLVDALRAYLRQRLGEEPPPQLLRDIELPAHLRINVRVVDAAGRELAMDRDTAALRERLREAARLEFAAEEPAFERRGLRQWDFGELPQTLAMQRDGQRLTGFPALIDEGNGVALTVLDTRDAADAATRKGVLRLIGVELGDSLARMLKAAPGLTTIGMQLRAVVAPDRLQDDLRSAIADRAFIGDDALPRDRDAFHTQVKRARARLPAVVDSALRLLGAIAAEHHTLSQRLSALPASQRMLAAEAKAQRDALVYPGFISVTPWAQLNELPRYLQALSRRIDRYSLHPERDSRHAVQIAQWWGRYRERADAERRAGAVSPALEAFRWMLEELRVSLFAQELRTPYPVSFKRVEKAWQALSRHR
jgi:ATP-dependent helicase HrpA